MTAFAAFLRGVNLGRRTVRSADLRAAFAEMGFGGVRTLLASGNVLFEGEGEEAALRSRIETALAARFGFAIGTVLRSRDALEKMVAADPFAGREEDADTKLYVTLLAEPGAGTVTPDLAIPGNFDIAGITAREIFLIGHRQPDGRFSEGMQVVHDALGKDRLWTSRNWNTILKAIA